MSVTLPPNLQRPVAPRAELTPTSQKPEPAAQQAALPLAKVVTSVESAPTAVQTEHASDAFAAEDAIRMLQGWANRFASGAGASPEADALRVGQACAPQEAAPQIGDWEDDASVVQQTKEQNCGAAVAVMLGNEKGTGKTQAASDTEKMDALDSRFTDGDGTTPIELSNMLASQGVKVTESASKLDKGLLDDALSRDGKAAVLVDSSKVDPRAQAGEKGQAHWVTVEGKDDQGRYKVKDPGTGKSVKMDADKLSDAVDTSLREHKTGGMVIVEGANGASEEQVAAESNSKVASLANEEGGGSRAMSRFGRESS
ncbi:hypothetical protein G4177_08045 [Corallococcus sp. ZKHCc1 1396]|uniref:Peptidase C39 n=1 Tax=Corallococcus soli TaxID=2710757 RepID=A0ABR9PJP8_9BACT|nr:hypothetical protein [Corallococcus soli]MBE4748131.1 hypothetical protein [Corallococcus soli]